MKEKVKILEKIETEQVRSEYTKVSEKLWDDPDKRKDCTTFSEFEQKMWNEVDAKSNTNHIYRMLKRPIENSPKFEQDLNIAIEQAATARQENHDAIDKGKVHFIKL